MTPRVATEMKLRPSQARAHETIEQIVHAAGELLEELGFERLTTNLVCERAKLTPPALYRYFPNKYALLRELGERLMRAQDDAVLALVARAGLTPRTAGELERVTYDIQRAVNAVTKRFPGNIAILRALRAVPILRDVRLASRDMVSARLARALAPVFPHIPPKRLAVATRLTTEWGYAATELVLEEPKRDADALTRETARAVAAYYAALNKAYRPKA